MIRQCRVFILKEISSFLPFIKIYSNGSSFVPAVGSKSSFDYIANLFDCQLSDESNEGISNLER